MEGQHLSAGPYSSVNMQVRRKMVILTHLQSPLTASLDLRQVVEAAKGRVPIAETKSTSRLMEIMMMIRPRYQRGAQYLLARLS